MGSCISKCKPSKKKENSSKKQESIEEDHVQHQDKLVVAVSENPPLKSQPPQKSQNPNSFLNPLSPSPSHSSCSSTSFSCSTNRHNSPSSSLSSASSCASSISKDKSSFSNEFLKSRLKQNSQIVLLDPNASSAPPSLPPHKPNSPVSGPTQKRQRASSPNLARQKSFRRDPVGPTLISANKPSSLRSPSPSRRFVSNGTPQNCKRVVSNCKGNPSFRKSNISVVNNSVGGHMKKETLKGLSDPNNRSRRSIRSPSMKKEVEICSLNRVVSRVDGITIGEEKNIGSLQDVEMLPVEDLNNPLIALDCFIFL